MSQVTQSLEVQIGGGPVSSLSLNKGEKLVHPRPRRWNCTRQESHWDSNSHNEHTRNQIKVVIPASIVQMTQRWSWKKLLSFHCGQVIDPDDGAGDHQVLLSQPVLQHEVVLPWTDVCYMPIVVIYVLSSPTRGSKSLGSATDANATM